MESCFGYMKSILFQRNPLLFQKTFLQVQKIIQQFTVFWNNEWILTKLNNLSPLQYMQSLR